MNKNRRNKNLVLSLDKALDIIEALSSSPKGLKVKEISEKLLFPTATVHRILNTLASRGYVEQDSETSKYYLGMKMLSLQGTLTRNLNLVSKALPHLSDLSSKCNETVHLAVLDQGEVVYINTLISSHSFAMYTPIGTRNPAHSTALGKSLLSGLSQEEMERVIQEKGLPRFTPNTITQPQRLKREIEQVRVRGYAVDNEENEVGGRCISAPVRNHKGKIIAAVSVSAPAIRMGRERDEEIAREVISTCDKMSSSLGYEK